MEPVFEVLEPGLLTTVQDVGRRGFGDLGVPISGACDSWSLAEANALLGNDPGAAALESTLLGPELRALRDVVIAVAGADLQTEIRPSGRRIAIGTTASLRAGDVLALPSPADAGARAYVAVPGGVDVPLVLGSRSTCLVASFGGFDGRALRAGDIVAAAWADPSRDDVRRWPGPHTPTGGGTVRVLPGPDSNLGLLAALSARPWSVSTSSDRRGVRLVGDALGAPPAAGERLTIGVLPGSVQLPPDGQPIVLLADAQPTGGYPVIGVVIEADLPIAGQLAAADDVRFEVISPGEAATANLARRSALAAGIAALRGT
ncbi:MAG: biotin-dependent carboxyltransferase family protein [Chloroflexi bacterium]|nr:biotin-dependent carboxyltransferase family protein [Chloroflexota bacterium]